MSQQKAIVLAFFASIVLMAAGGGMPVAVAQQPGAPAPPPASPPAAAPAGAAAQVPSLTLEQLLTLVRNTTIAINQANLTNNYSVVRDLGTPGFQSANSPERLSELFTPLRNQKLDVAVILAVSPEFKAQPSIDDKGRMRLTGFYATNPQVHFDYIYEQVGGQWRHFGVYMWFTPPPPAQAAAKAPAAPAAEKKKAAPPPKKTETPAPAPK